MRRLIGSLPVALLLAACSGSPTVPNTGTPAQTIPRTKTVANQNLHYIVTNLGSLGGTVSAGISINGLGSISGFSGASGNAAFHAALWRPGSTSATDLGTLGGTHSAVEWPNHNPTAIVGISQTSRPDPLGERWSCSAFIPYTGTTCLGFVWHASRMIALPTLGGNNGFAAAANIAGSIAGWAENSVHDSTCVSPQVLQFEAVVWDGNNHPHALPPLPGDLDGAATTINRFGDVAGISGICQNAVGGLTAKHAVLWHNGVPTDIGNLGGAAWNTPMAMNDLGVIVGFSDLPGDANGAAPNFQAFRWTKSSGIQNLHTLPGDVLSQALGVNIAGQIVGLSCNAGCATLRAFIWQNGVMSDLNDLVAPGSPYLVYANDINDEGVITGLGVDQSGNAIAFRAVPSYGALGATSHARARSLHGLGLHLGAFGRIAPKLP